MTLDAFTFPNRALSDKYNYEIGFILYNIVMTENIHFTKLYKTLLPNSPTVFGRTDQPSVRTSRLLALNWLPKPPYFGATGTLQSDWLAL